MALSHGDLAVYHDVISVVDNTVYYRIRYRAVVLRV